MQRRLILAVVLFVVTICVADEDLVVAKIVDSDSDRIPVYTVAPEYPRKARRDRIEATVQVCFEINRQGRPRRVAVRNSTNRAFEGPSLKAVKASSFRPLKDDQKLQSIKSCRTFIFSLEPAE
jgi:TonB family protein